MSYWTQGAIFWGSLSWTPSATTRLFRSRISGRGNRLPSSCRQIWWLCFLDSITTTTITSNDVHSESRNLKIHAQQGLVGDMKMEKCFHSFCSVGSHKLLTLRNTIVPVSTKLCPGAPWPLSQLISGFPERSHGPGGSPVPYSSTHPFWLASALQVLVIKYFVYHSVVSSSKHTNFTFWKKPFSLCPPVRWHIVEWKREQDQTPALSKTPLKPV